MATMPKKLLPWLMVFLVWCGFAALGRIVRQLLLPHLPPAPWMAQAALKLSLILAVIVLAWRTRCGRDCLGLRNLTLRAGSPYWALGLALGAVTSFGLLSTHQTGLSRVLGAMSFPALVVWVWFVSSVSEEFLCRGWFQAMLERNSESAGDPARVLWPSAVLFGSLHLTLFWAGVPPVSAVCIVAATTALGYVCALARARSKNLGPAIAAHVAFNVGGMLGGIAHVIVYRIVNGHLPPLPGA